MFKRTWNSPHFIARAAGHSTKGTRTGRVDVLPPDAVEQLFLIADQIRDGESRLESLRQELSLAKDRMHFERRIAQTKARIESGSGSDQLPGESGLVASIERQIENTKARLAELRPLLRIRAGRSYEGAFVALAKAQLSHSVFSQIDEQARKITGKVGK